MWLVLAPALAVLAAGLIGYAPTRSIGGDPAVLAMGIACGLSALAAIFGSTPVIWALLRSPDKLHLMALAATTLRAVILVVMVVPVAALAGLNLRALLIWVGIGYVVALFGEILALVLVIRRMETRK